MINFLEYALKYAELGWRVFPVVPRQKMPLTKHGCLDATLDKKKIEEWWRKWPNANIGIATGNDSGIGVIDIDVDEEKGINGFDTLRELGIDIPATVCQETPRGGCHAFFSIDKPFKNSTGSIGKGIDTRGDGGYVLVYPSIGPNGRPYKWVDTYSPWDRVSFDMPSTFGHDERSPVRQDGGEVMPPISQICRDNVTERAAAYLRECEPAVQGCHGHDSLFWAATALVHGFELSDSQAFDLLAREYNPRCVPEWDLSVPSELKDFRRKIDEARRKPADKPRGWLLEEVSTIQYSREDIEFLIQSSQKKIRIIEGVGKEKENGELDFLCKPTGLLGDICGWINKTADRRQPFLTLGCALTTLGAVLGRRVKQENVRTNLYAIGIAESCSGKDHPIHACRRILEESGCGNMIGGQGVTSDSAIEKALFDRSPTLMLFWDEIGHLLSAIKKDSSMFTSGITSTLMTIYSRSKDVYIGKERATGDRYRIEQPCLCIYGSSTPRKFYDACSYGEIGDGWLGRFLFFVSNDIPSAQIVNESDRVIPSTIIEQVKFWRGKWKSTIPDDCKDIAMAIGRMNEGPLSIPDPEPIKIVREADMMIRELDEIFLKKMRSGDADAPLWGRAAENTRRISLAIACGNNPENPVIDCDVADYAMRLVAFLRHQFETLAMPEMHTGINDTARCEIVKFVERAGEGGASKSAVAKIPSIRNMKPNDRDAIIRDLISLGEIIVDTVRGGSRYYALKYWKKHIEKQ